MFDEIFENARKVNEETGDYLVDMDLFGEELKNILPEKDYRKLSQLVKRQDSLMSRIEDSDAVTTWGKFWSLFRCRRFYSVGERSGKFS